MLQQPPPRGNHRDWYATGAAIRVMVLLALTAVDDWVSALLGVRPVRWHARRIVRTSRAIWWLALYGPPAEEVDGVYDAEIVDEEGNGR